MTLLNFLAFVMLQCYDGLFTFLGIQQWGLAVEANPLLRLAASHIGLIPALAIAKISSILIGYGIYRRGWHHVLFVLTIVFACVSVDWMLALTGVW